MLSCVQREQSPMMELIEIGEKMQKHLNIEYSYVINNQTSYSGKWPTIEGLISFIENKSDTAIGMKFRIQEEDFDCIYDGNFVYTLLKMDSAIIKKPLNDFIDGHCTTYPALELSYTAISLFLSDPNIENEIKYLVKSDTLINSEPYYKYTFVANERFLSTHKNFAKNDAKVEIVIQQSKSLPLSYSIRKEFKSGEQIHASFAEAIFSQYSFKNNYPSSFFESESIPTYYNWTKLKYLNNTLPVNTSAPSWTLPKIDGDSVSLHDFKGQYVLLDFWFIGCGACIQSIPMLNELHNMNSKVPLTVIGINCLSTDLSKIEAYCANHEMNYQNVWMGDNIGNVYRINAAPIYYLIDPKGNIVYTQFGHDEGLLNAVESIVNQNTP